MVTGLSTSFIIESVFFLSVENMKFLTAIRVEPRAKCRKPNRHRIKFVQIPSLKRWFAVKSLVLNDACDVEQAKSRFALINNPQLFQNILITKRHCKTTDSDSFASDIFDKISKKKCKQHYDSVRSLTETLATL